MLDQIVGGYKHGHGHGHGYGGHPTSGYGFEEHKEFTSHAESGRGYVDSRTRYDHKMRLPPNSGRPPMTHMPAFDEDSDVEEHFVSSRKHHTSGMMGNGGHGMQHHGGYEMHGGLGMQHHGGHGMQHHGGHGMQHHGGHGMQHHSGLGMHHVGMKQDMFMGSHVPPPSHGYGNPMHGGVGGRVHHKVGWGSKAL